jgi:hypothetical protein
VLFIVFVSSSNMMRKATDVHIVGGEFNRVEGDYVVIDGSERGAFSSSRYPSRSELHNIIGIILFLHEQVEGLKQSLRSLKRRMSKMKV